MDWPDFMSVIKRIHLSKHQSERTAPGLKMDWTNSYGQGLVVLEEIVMAVASVAFCSDVALVKQLYQKLATFLY